jgi:Holliday junction resolvase RusA-like endonuclease
MEARFVIKGKLPGLNDYLKAERSFSKKHSCGNDMKQQCQFLISNAIRVQLKRIHFNNPVHITYKFYEPNRKRDLDNISSVAHKFIQDSLVKCKVIDNDGWSHIIGFSDEFSCDSGNPRIEVTIRERMG